jgi:hypothetical protein
LLFNSIVDLLRKQEPHFDGNYLPALDAAENLLVANTSGSCALTLFFLSDGKPSDHLPSGTGMYCMSQMMGTRIDALASRFGRRLSVVTVGFAGLGEDFRVLETMASRPAQFGSIGKFHAARLNAESLGIAFSSLTSSLNATRTELTSLDGATQRAVRDVRREKRDTVDDMGVNDNWYVYWYSDPGKERQDRIVSGSWQQNRSIWSVEERTWIATPPLENTACGVALRKQFFGEGAERLVRKFREVAPNGYFVGPLLVAKESRFQADVAYIDRRKIIDFHRSFCDTQRRAQKLASIFNDKLTKLPGFTSTTPTICFLDCSVYEVEDLRIGKIGVLVEKQLNGEYKKWNDNCGFVDGQDTAVPNKAGKAAAALERIAESDEDDDDDEEEDDDDDGEDLPIYIYIA